MRELSVPFFPPNMFEQDKSLIKSIVRKAGQNNQFILKDEVSALEAEMCEYSGAKHVIAVHSGTGALGMALRALDIGCNDEVITQSFCCQPVASEVVHLGAKPIFVDVDPDTSVMNPEKIVDSITSKTKAIIPAHLFSCMVDMPRLLEIADAHNIPVIEDACVVQGASLLGKKAGTFGRLGTWSFFQHKAMGGCGEGGVVLTDDDSLADKCRYLRNHGQTSRFYHELLGVNSRMDEIMAAYLRHRLRHYDGMLSRRADIAEFYHKSLAPVSEVIKRPPSGREGRCYYMYNIQLTRRDELKEYLEKRGIGSQVYYPRPIHTQHGYLEYSDNKDLLTESIRISKENLSLPMYPTLRDEQAQTVVDVILEFYNAS